jgi:hypothetical protein
MVKVIKLPDATPFSHVEYNRLLGICSKNAIAVTGRLCQCRALSYYNEDKSLDYLYHHSKSDGFKNSGPNFIGDFHLEDKDQMLLSVSSLA